MGGRITATSIGVVSVGVVGAALLVAPRDARARYTPVMREDVAGLVKRRAFVYVSRPCRIYGEPGRYLLPGDKLRATHRVPTGGGLDRNKIGYRTKGKRRAVLIHCLSKSALDYRFRGRGSLREFVDRLTRDVPRLVARQCALRREAQMAKQPAQRRRAHRLQRRVSRYTSDLTGRLWRLTRRNARSRMLRTLLRREGGWVAQRGASFLRRYAGLDRPRELVRRLAEINRAITLLWRTCKLQARRRRHLRKLARYKSGREYANAPPSVRRKLVAEDVKRLLGRVSGLQSRISMTSSRARAIFRRLKLVVRWR